jgi:recombination protein RecT
MPPRNQGKTRGDGTLTGAVAQRNAADQQAKAHLEEVEARVEAATKWFRRVVPAHVNAEQYLGLLIGELRLNPKLANAAWHNPISLMVAASECARLGLIPGDTYFFVPFRNTTERRQADWDISGMVHYSGEIDLMFRSGGVASVHCQVVREADHFLWQPRMVLPEHEIPDDGLAEDEDRGPLRAVYAYARLTTGGISEVAVLNRGAVMRARSKAKTLDFWGPDWPSEGPDTVPMWRKTAVHRLWNYVPHSAEFIAERLRAAAAAAQPLAGLPAPQRAEVVNMPTRAAVGPAQPAPADDTQHGSGEASPGSQGATAPRGARPSPGQAQPAGEPRSASEAWEQAGPPGGE